MKLPTTQDEFVARLKAAFEDGHHEGYGDGICDEQREEYTSEPDFESWLADCEVGDDE